MNAKLVLILFSSLFAVCFGGVLAKSEIELCTSTSTPDSTTETCTEKLYLLLSLTTWGEPVRIRITETTVGDGVEVLDPPLEITISAHGGLYYHLQDLTTVYSEVRESVRYHPIASCELQDPQTNPATGEKLLHSEGFCCSCSISETLGFTSKPRRGNPSCSLLDSAGTSHWISFSGDAYKLSEVKGYTKGLRIQMEGKQGDKTVFSGSSYDFGASVKSSNILDVVTELVNVDLIDETTFPQSGYIAHNTQNTEEWLSLPYGMVTLDGSECDKVGTSYSGFYSQGERCYRPLESCLNNQVGALIAEDRRRVEQGAAPLYKGDKEWVSGYAGFALEAQIRFTMSLRLPVSKVAILRNLPSDVNIVSVVYDVLLDAAKVTIVLENNGTLSGAYLVRFEFEEGPAGPALRSTVSQYEIHIVRGQRETIVATLLRENATNAVYNFALAIFDKEVNLITRQHYNITVATNTFVKDQRTGTAGGAHPNSEQNHGEGFCLFKAECYEEILALIAVVLIAIAVVFVLFKLGCCVSCLSSCLKSCTSGGKEERKTIQGYPSAPPPIVIHHATPLPASVTGLSHVVDVPQKSRKAVEQEKEKGRATSAFVGEAKPKETKKVHWKPATTPNPFKDVSLKSHTQTTPQMDNDSRVREWKADSLV